MQFMARAALVFDPQAIIIENVVGSLRDEEGIVHSVESIFRELGYFVDVGILDFAALGVPAAQKTYDHDRYETCCDQRVWRPSSVPIPAKICRMGD
jgi:hypothetical protein